MAMDEIGWITYQLSVEGQGYAEVLYISGVGDWEWSDVVVVQGPDRTSYWVGTDCGCSCHSPFEYTESLDDLTGPLTLEQAKESVEISVRDDWIICDNNGLESDEDVHRYVEEEFQFGFERLEARRASLSESASGSQKDAGMADSSGGKA